MLEYENNIQEAYEKIQSYLKSNELFKFLTDINIKQDTEKYRKLYYQDNLSVLTAKEKAEAKSKYNECEKLIDNISKCIKTLGEKETIENKIKITELENLMDDVLTIKYFLRGQFVCRALKDDKYCKSIFCYNGLEDCPAIFKSKHGYGRRREKIKTKN